jgi:lysophospholipase L1-like esterase
VQNAIVRLNRATRTVANAYGVPCLDVAGHPGLSVPENFAEDGLHPSALGHERAALGFAELLAETFAIEFDEGGEADEPDHG